MEALKPKAKRQKQQVRRSKREQRNRWVAITIILALILSFLVGALSITAAPSASAAERIGVNNSVQVFSANQEIVDTDGDGIENNADPDVDGDGLVNGEDPDIDGDGIENFEDADPINTTDLDSNAPEKPVRPEGAGDEFGQSSVWIWLVVGIVVISSNLAWMLAKRRKK